MWINVGLLPRIAKGDRASVGIVLEGRALLDERHRSPRQCLFVHGQLFGNRDRETAVQGNSILGDKANAVGNLFTCLVVLGLHSDLFQGAWLGGVPQVGVVDLQDQVVLIVDGYLEHICRLDAFRVLHVQERKLDEVLAVDVVLGRWNQI